MASRSIKNRPGIKKKHPSIGFLAVFTVFLAVIVAGFSGVYALGSSWIGDLEDYDVSDAGQLNSSLPSITSPDAWEKRMAEGVAFLARMKAEAARG